LENEKSAGGIHIGNVGGDVIGVGVTGSGNVIGTNIIVNRQQLQNIPSEYSESLKEFIKELNKFNIPPEQAKPIQDSLNDFTEEIEDMKPEEKVDTVKQKSLNSKFSIFAQKVLKILPKTAETIAAFTPLAPFSKLIGEEVQQLVNVIQKDT
jgi:hypothetical protein